MSNIKEQICQEIERQRSLIEGLFIEGDNSFYDGQDDAYNHLLAFIDSLPIAGSNYQRLKRLAEAAKSSSHLDAYIEGVRRSIEKQIGQLPPPPPGYYYTWELDTIRKEGQSFTAIARPLLKQINPEQ